MNKSSINKLKSAIRKDMKDSLREFKEEWAYQSMERTTYGIAFVILEGLCEDKSLNQSGLVEQVMQKANESEDVYPRSHIKTVCEEIDCSESQLKELCEEVYDEFKQKF